jgi:hypothetical protein
MVAKYKYNTDRFASDNAIAYYLLGAFMTDGCIHTVKSRPSVRYAAFDSSELDWISNIRNQIATDVPIRRERTTYRLAVNNIEITDWLINKGCTPRKSLTLQYPKIPDQYLPDFLRGCWDGDGCIGTYTNTTVNKKGIIYKYPKPQSYLCSSSIDFIKPMYNELINIGYNPTFQHKKCKGQSTFAKSENRDIIYTNDMYLIRFSTKKCKEFLEWIYYPGHEISNPRKYKKALEIINHYNN